MTGPILADAAAVSDLLDVFASYDGGVIFQGLFGASGLLGRIGWIFTAFAAFFVLWGFVLRSRGAAGEDKLGEIVRTWVVIGFMVGGPFLMRTAMEAADGIYSSAVGGPGGLAAACAKAAYAMPELDSLYDRLRTKALDGTAAGTPSSGPSGSPTEMGLGGYLKASLDAVANQAADYAKGALGAWSGLARIFALLSGFGSGIAKCLLVELTLLPLYFLFLACAGLLWFMEQLRYFLAVVGTMMLPFFVGMFSLPAGHPNRPAAQAYVMNLVSLALWPVAWAIGHTGTVVLYDALISLIAGTSRVPAISAALQWSAIAASGSSLDASQLRAMEAALGNWYMGNVAALLAILVGAIGFALWVFIVCIFGPVFLHRTLTAGALFVSQAVAATGRHGWTIGSTGIGLAARGLGAPRGEGAPPSAGGWEGSLSASAAVPGVPATGARLGREAASGRDAAHATMEGTDTSLRE